MVQSPKDTPFGLDANVAAGLAYLLGIIGGIIMLVGGGTNKFVKWAACQSITFFLVCFVIRLVLQIIVGFLPFMWSLAFPLYSLVSLVFFIGWIYTWIMGFQGKEVRLPVVADITQSVFGSQLA
jgi:uncharacterized membrane protein